MSFKNKFFSALLAGSMGLAMAAPVLAKDSIDNPNVPNIEKTLNVADGITFEHTFTFTLEQDLKNSSLGIDHQFPTISAKTITVSEKDKVNSIDILSAEEIKTFENAVPGRYAYTLKEQNDGTAGVTFDKKEYTVFVDVANEMKGDYTGKKEVHYAIVDQTAETENHKVSAAKFANTFVKEDSSLAVTKKVEGKYANRDHAFNFTIRFTKNSTDTDNTFVLKKALNLNGVSTTEITYDTDYKFTLKHGENILFEGVPAGTHYTVTEEKTADYTTTSTTVENGGQPTTNNPGEKAENKLIGENNNKTDYVNTNTKGEDIIPGTGITTNNLPFILLFVVGTIGVGFYLTSKRRMN